MITYQMISEIGDRAKNEDMIGVWRDHGLFCAVLADGLGGHGDGEAASALVVECVIELFRKELKVSAECLSLCFDKSQEYLLEEQRKRKKEQGMKTTLSIFMSDQQKTVWGHVGDSRIYQFEDGKIKSRTLDHSVPQALASAGEISEKEIQNHPDRNRLLRVMGIPWNRPAYSLSEACQCEGKQAFLLCSDGFWERIGEREMEQCLKRATDVNMWLETMHKKVKRTGKKKDKDNYSAIAIWL